MNKANPIIGKNKADLWSTKNWLAPLINMIHLLIFSLKQ
jgi:hypothetical protein